jgi:hypothetical protein
MVAKAPHQKNAKFVCESEISEVKKSLEGFKKGEIAYRTALSLLDKLSKSNPRGFADVESALLGFVAKVDEKSSDVFEPTDWEVVVYEDRSVMVRRYLNDSHTLEEVIDADGKADIFWLRQYESGGYSVPFQLDRDSDGDERMKDADAVLKAVVGQN